MTNAILGLLLVLLLALGLAARFVPTRRPKETHFRCASCNARTSHTSRTIQAWRQNQTRFFCQSCHQRWLASRPARQSARIEGVTAGRRSGCLGILVWIAVLPLVVISGLVLFLGA